MAGPQNEKSPVPEGILMPALKVGAMTGTIGLLPGSLIGTLTSQTPVLFALTTSLQWSLLSSTFYATRSTLLHTRTFSPNAPLSLYFDSRFWSSPANQDDQAIAERPRDLGPITTEERLRASAASGGLTGGLTAALLRGRRNILPATLMFSLLGYGGQKLYTALDTRHTANVQANADALEEGKATNGNAGGKSENWWAWVFNRKWSPMKVLSDSEYERILREKLAKVEAEMKLLDEEIEGLRSGESEEMDGDLAKGN